MSDHNRFQDYREITARQTAHPAACGHDVKVGDRIGWNPRTKRVKCAGCWAKWASENAEADLYESNLNGYGY